MWGQFLFNCIIAECDIEEIGLEKKIIFGQDRTGRTGQDERDGTNGSGKTGQTKGLINKNELSPHVFH